MHQKRALIEAMLKRGKIQIGLDPQVEGVEIPKEYLGQPAVYLNLSHRYPESLKFYSETLHAQLSFKGQPFYCVIPWKAIWIVKEQNGNIVSFPDALHPRLLGFLVNSSPPPDKKKVPNFEVIDGGGETTPPRNPPLRRVK